jgi:hypothetical protein
MKRERKKTTFSEKRSLRDNKKNLSGRPRRHEPFETKAG